jgi:hypothetical protein
LGKQDLIQRIVLRILEGLAIPHPQEIKNAIEPERADPDLGLLLDLGLGVESHAEPRQLEHGDVVGAIPDCYHLLQ